MMSFVDLVPALLLLIVMLALPLVVVVRICRCWRERSRR